MTRSVDRDRSGRTGWPGCGRRSTPSRSPSTPPWPPPTPPATAQLLDGATNTAAWLRHTLRLAPRDAAGHVRTARTLSPDHSTSCRSLARRPGSAAVLAGTISYPHLQAITGTLADLADHPGLPPEPPPRPWR